MVHPEVKNWIKYARFEEKHGYIAHGRKVYERAVEFFGEDHVEENLFVAFAKFEETQKEVCVQYRTKVTCKRLYGFKSESKRVHIYVFRSELCFGCNYYV